ncbi:uncharacterized protein LOC126847721 isoform X2 [Adelges cooleyi]|uniref:uncharacterized protein LOC126847721 isoform X2 n=1 Tax=Adelges cooleyi TaxID=133065 RepID=UPI00217FC05D|nr:uncharacterized protein LOC126847721 isoform X2 [Adelges cooleyi]
MGCLLSVYKKVRSKSSASDRNTARSVTDNESSEQGSNDQRTIPSGSVDSDADGLSIRYVEATAVRTLAANTGSVAILGMTANVRTPNDSPSRVRPSTSTYLPEVRYVEATACRTLAAETGSIAILGTTADPKATRNEDAGSVHLVEATAVRQLAAETGTIAILASTAAGVNRPIGSEVTGDVIPVGVSEALDSHGNPPESECRQSNPGGGDEPMIPETVAQAMEQEPAREPLTKSAEELIKSQLDLGLTPIPPFQKCKNFNKNNRAMTVDCTRDPPPHEVSQSGMRKWVTEDLEDIAESDNSLRPPSAGNVPTKRLSEGTVRPLPKAPRSSIPNDLQSEASTSRAGQPALQKQGSNDSVRKYMQVLETQKSKDLCNGETDDSDDDRMIECFNVISRKGSKDGSKKNSIPNEKTENKPKSKDLGFITPIFGRKKSKTDSVEQSCAAEVATPPNGVVTFLNKRSFSWTKSREKNSTESVSETKTLISQLSRDSSSKDSETRRSSADDFSHPFEPDNVAVAISAALAMNHARSEGSDDASTSRRAKTLQRQSNRLTEHRRSSNDSVTGVSEGASTSAPKPYRNQRSVLVEPFWRVPIPQFAKCPPAKSKSLPCSENVTKKEEAHVQRGASLPAEQDDLKAELILTVVEERQEKASPIEDVTVGPNLIETVNDGRDAIVDEANAIVDQGNAVVDKGNAIIDEGDDIVNKGNALVDKGNAIVDKGEAIVDKGNAIVDEGNAIVDEGNAIVDEGNAIVGEGNVIVDKGNAIVDKGEAIVDKGNAIADEDVAAQCLEEYKLTLINSVKDAVNLLCDQAVEKTVAIVNAQRERQLAEQLASARNSIVADMSDLTDINSSEFSLPPPPTTQSESVAQGADSTWPPPPPLSEADEEKTIGNELSFDLPDPPTEMDRLDSDDEKPITGAEQAGEHGEPTADMKSTKTPVATADGGNGGGSADERAATTIQAVYRGFRARKYAETVNAAAAKIQAGFRGYRVRQSLKNGAPASTATTTENSLCWSDDEQQKSVVSGVVAADDVVGPAAVRHRTDDEARTDAAIKIQARVRGYVTRKRLSKEKNERDGGDTKREDGTDN